MRFQFQHTPMLMTFQKSETESLTTFFDWRIIPAGLKARINQTSGHVGPPASFVLLILILHQGHLRCHLQFEHHRDPPI